MTALLDISTDTRYLAINGTPLTQAAVEQLERAWSGHDLSEADWIACVVITHGQGDQRFSHDVAIGKLRTMHPGNVRQKTNFVQLVALRISSLTDIEKQVKLRALPFALLMF